LSGDSILCGHEIEHNPKIHIVGEPIPLGLADAQVAVKIDAWRLIFIVTTVFVGVVVVLQPPWRAVPPSEVVTAA
jgi:hypothetical protein